MNLRCAISCSLRYDMIFTENSFPHSLCCIGKLEIDILVVKMQSLQVVLTDINAPMSKKRGADQRTIDKRHRKRKESKDLPNTKSCDNHSSSPLKCKGSEVQNLEASNVDESKVDSSVDVSSPGTLSESFEMRVARKLMERNQRLGRQASLNPLYIEETSKPSASNGKIDNSNLNIGISNNLKSSKNYSNIEAMKKKGEKISKFDNKISSSNSEIFSIGIDLTIDNSRSSSDVCITSTKGGENKKESQMTSEKMHSMARKRQNEVVNLTGDGQLSSPVYTASNLDKFNGAQLVDKTNSLTNTDADVLITCAIDKVNDPNSTQVVSEVSPLTNQGYVDEINDLTGESSPTESSVVFMTVALNKENGQYNVDLNSSSSNKFTGRKNVQYKKHSQADNSKNNSRGSRSSSNVNLSSHDIEEANENSYAPVFSDVHFECVHPSKRISLLSYKYPGREKSKLSKLTSREISSKRNDMDTQLPHHPSLRLFNDISSDSTVQSRSKSLTKEIINETVDLEDVREVFPNKNESVRPRMLLNPLSSRSQGSLINVISNESDFDIVGISDSESDATASEDIVMTNIYHISSDEEDADYTSDNSIVISEVDVPSIADNESLYMNSECYIIPSDEECVAEISCENGNASSEKAMEKFIPNSSAIEPIIVEEQMITRQRRKSSSETRNTQNKSIDSVAVEQHAFKSVSLTQFIKLKAYFNLSDIQVTLVKLEPRTICRLIELCRSEKNWKQRNLLLKAGLDEFDVQRISVNDTPVVNSRCTFRKSYRGVNVFDTGNYKGKQRNKERSNKNSIMSRKTKLKTRKLERIRNKEIDIASIRRALLKINSKFMNQNRLWSYLRNSHIT